MTDDNEVQQMLREVDETVSARLFLTQTGTKEMLIGLLTELGRVNGYRLDKGDRAILNPVNVPAHIRFTPEDPVLVSATAPEDQILFTNNQANGAPS